ncbi:unnamed protein product, partial [Mesorhabditis spiculigera]
MSTQENGTTQTPSTPQKTLNTQERLFGGNAPTTPKRMTPTFKSTIFDGQQPPASPQRTPKKVIRTIERNPITGEVKAGQQQKITA